ncbi:putative vacuolar ATP synthase subunit C [Gregarina niphandrodes]|uniref:V-type proton ATPase subunit C n=1 Tax=Gregarina niphandrodes TaxID=110365 RepID=A0A023BC05_GRENI|nr:putative vacuolar ATP synthase subunit C [Gregarina niphandrodes]EZG80924.1 putative vacuolar ATP synthase subunit C [Gregarina niphandrodes]|eukprot:XP_011134282.1 putative vacuolar ATP synthase subunit C [Gregarina niphandrodes]
MASANTEYWIVATSEKASGSRDGTYSLMKSKLQQAKIIDDIAVSNLNTFSIYFQAIHTPVSLSDKCLLQVFDVPSKLKFGRLDDLVALLDDVQKYENLIEQTCHRLEKMGLEVDPSAEFKIIWQRNTLSADEYLKKFVWDEAKYAATRLLRQNVELIVNSVVKLDDEIRVKASQFQELKNQLAALSKGANLGMANRDLVDVLTPDVVGNGNGFVYSEKLNTVICIVPRSDSPNFERDYWRLNEFVVPTSLVKYEIPKDTTSNRTEDVAVYSVTLFRKNVNQFKDACRQQKIVVRDNFTFDPNAFTEKAGRKAKLEAEKMQQEATLSRICVAAFSECFVSLVHMKAANVYIEGLLRYGTDTKVNSYVLQLPAKVKEQKLRDIILEIMGTKNIMGKDYFINDKQTDDETLYPYIQLSLTPFVQFQQK